MSYGCPAKIDPVVRAIHQVPLASKRNSHSASRKNNHILHATPLGFRKNQTTQVRSCSGHPYRSCDTHDTCAPELHRFPDPRLHIAPAPCIPELAKQFARPKSQPSPMAHLCLWTPRHLNRFHTLPANKPGPRLPIAWSNSPPSLPDASASLKYRAKYVPTPHRFDFMRFFNFPLNYTALFCIIHRHTERDECL